MFPKGDSVPLPTVDIDNRSRISARLIFVVLLGLGLLNNYHIAHVLHNPILS